MLTGGILGGLREGTGEGGAGEGNNGTRRLVASGRPEGARARDHRPCSPVVDKEAPPSTSVNPGNLASLLPGRGYHATPGPRRRRKQRRSGTREAGRHDVQKPRK